MSDEKGDGILIVVLMVLMGIVMAHADSGAVGIAGACASLICMAALARWVR